MARKKITTTIYITADQERKLKQLSQRTKIPVSVYIREGIDLVLGRYEHVLPGQLSLLDLVR
jgi:predicted DNA-binding protein